MKTLKSAVIGLGAIHMNHVRVIKNMPNAELVCVCEIDPDLLQRKMAEFQCKGYTDYREMLEKEDIDVVHICTPHYLHAPMAIYAMETGHNVLVEKPMGLNTEETSRMIETALRTGKRLGVCFQNRYNPTSKRVRELLDEGTLGTVQAAKMVVTWDRDAAYYGQAAWRGTWAQEGGGVMINQAIHTLDLMQWYAGVPETVQAQTSSFRLGDVIEVEDTAHGYFHYANGATGIFYATNAYGSHSPIEVELVCEKGRIDLKGDLVIRYPDGTTEHLDDTSMATGPKAYWGDGHERLIQDYYEKLIRNEPFPIDSTEGAKAVRIFEAIYASAADGGKKIHVQTIS